MEITTTQPLKNKITTQSLESKLIDTLTTLAELSRQTQLTISKEIPKLRSRLTTLNHEVAKSQHNSLVTLIKITGASLSILGGIQILHSPTKPNSLFELLSRSTEPLATTTESYILTPKRILTTGQEDLYKQIQQATLDWERKNTEDIQTKIRNLQELLSLIDQTIRTESQ